MILGLDLAEAKRLINDALDQPQQPVDLVQLIAAFADSHDIPY
jgi:hypothetical protein